MATPEQKRAFVEQFNKKTAEYGWVVQCVFPRVGDPGPGFAYTVGLHEHGFKELIVFALPPATAQQLLNDVAADLMTRRAIQAPQEGLYRHARWPMAMQLVAADAGKASEYASFAWARSGQAAEFIQVVWPDPQGAFPWEASFEEEYHASQPLLR